MIIRRRKRESTQSGYLSITRRDGKGVYIGHYYEYPRDPETGKSKPLHRTLPDPIREVAQMTREAAKKKCARLVQQKLQKTTTHDGRTTFQSFAEAKYVPAFCADWGENTKNTKEADLRNYVYPFIGALALEEITISVLKEGFLNKLGETGNNYSESVIKRAKTLVSSILGYAVERDFLKGSPTASPSYKLPRCKKRSRTTLEKQEIGRALRAIKDDRNFVIMSFGQGGLIPAEIFGMQIADVRVDDTSLDLTLDDFVFVRNSASKGGLVLGRTKTEDRTRKAWISSKRMKAALLRLLEARPDAKPDEMLFESRVEGATIWSGTYLAKRIRPIVNKLGIRTPVTFQVLRRSYASWTRKMLLKQLQVVQRTMGHAAGSDVTERVYVQDVDDEANAQLVRDYVALCDVAATEHERKQQKRKLTGDDLAAAEIADHRPVTRRTQ